ncbi:ATP-binding protein [Paenarthrobacter aurescens]|uniref:ATP-binding protein n=1 Tax=Paenarthrobacter aurescens TaxID=43663 RepID=UPI0021C13F55|nr:ATP-binding protein [Paenarthrobacter aurescens]
MLDEEALHKDAVFNIGKVTSVEGRRVRVAVNKLKNSSHLLYQGKIVRNVAVGGFVKIAKGFVELVASVNGERVNEDPGASESYRRNVDLQNRQLEVSLVGYFEKGVFRRGVREMPLLDNECFLLSEDEFRAIHTFVSDDAGAIPLGVLAMEPTQPVLVGVDSVFASHVGIFGNTGSGKSYTLAKLYHELFEKFRDQPGFVDRSQFVLIDFNGEYVNRAPETAASTPNRSSSVIVDEQFKQEYRLSTRTDDGHRLPLPRSAVHDPVFWAILLDATEKTQAPFVARVLRNDYWDRLLPEPGALLEVIADAVARATKSTDPSMDRMLPTNFLEEIKDCLGSNTSNEFEAMVRDFRANLGYHSSTHTFYWGVKPSWKFASDADWSQFISHKISAVSQSFSSVDDVDLVRFKLVLQFYSDIIGGFINREHIGPLMKRLESRIDGIKRLITVSVGTPSSKPLTVVSLRDVNLDMRKVLPMILCRHLYETKKATDALGQQYLNLIIDEAHNILSFESARESEAWRDYRLETFEEIIKEGRKFGVFLTIASQRPHDISPTIISQLHNYFLHRLVNDLDIKAIEKAVSYLDRTSFESMPILPTGTCILSGVAAQIPVMVTVGELEPQFTPNSRTMSITEAWASPATRTEAQPAESVEPPF